MQISSDTKIRLFDLGLWYFFPLLALNVLSTFLASVVEMFWLPSEKESLTYLLAFYGVAVLRLVGGVLVSFLYLERGHPPFSRRVRKESILIGLGFSSALTGFFFGLTVLQPGFAVVPPQGWLFVWEVLLFRYLPIFMFYGVALQILLHDRHSIWLQVALAAFIQLLWSVGSELWAWSQGGHVFDWQTLYPMTTVLLAIALLKKFGIYSSLAALFVNALAYQTILGFSKFPIPSHVNSLLTIACLIFLIRTVQNLQFRPELLQAIHSQSAATGSSQPKPG
jgi:hypothetical protein